jgi:hypothetical protein
MRGLVWLLAELRPSQWSVHTLLAGLDQAASMRCFTSVTKRDGMP